MVTKFLVNVLDTVLTLIDDSSGFVRDTLSLFHSAEAAVVADDPLYDPRPKKRTASGLRQPASKRLASEVLVLEEGNRFIDRPRRATRAPKRLVE